MTDFSIRIAVGPIVESFLASNNIRRRHDDSRSCCNVWSCDLKDGQA